MCRFERRDDALKLGQKLEGVQRFVVGGGKKRDTADVGEPGMFRPDARIVEAGGDRVGLVDLAILVHQQIGAVAMQHARPPAGDRGGMHPGVEAMTRCFDAVNFDLPVVEERMKKTHGVRAAADAGDQ